MVVLQQVQLHGRREDRHLDLISLVRLPRRARAVARRRTGPRLAGIDAAVARRVVRLAARDARRAAVAGAARIARARTDEAPPGAVRLLQVLALVVVLDVAVPAAE